jgi:hypothetical protein
VSKSLNINFHLNGKSSCHEPAVFSSPGIRLAGTSEKLLPEELHSKKGNKNSKKKRRAIRTATATASGTTAKTKTRNNNKYNKNDESLLKKALNICLCSFIRAVCELSPALLQLSAPRNSELSSKVSVCELSIFIKH